MAVALAYPEPTNKGGQGKKTPQVNCEVSGEWIRQARFVLRHCPRVG